MKHGIRHLMLLVVLAAISATFFSAWIERYGKVKIVEEKIRSMPSELSRDKFIEWVGLESNDSTQHGFHITDGHIVGEEIGMGMSEKWDLPFGHVLTVSYGIRHFSEEPLFVCSVRIVDDEGNETVSK